MTEYECEYQLPAERQIESCCKRYQSYWGWLASFFLAIAFLIFVGYMVVNYDILHRTNRNCVKELDEANNQKSMLQSKLIDKVQDNLALSNNIRDMNRTLQLEKDKLRLTKTELEFYKTTLRQLKEKFAYQVNQLNVTNAQLQDELRKLRIEQQYKLTPNSTGIPEINLDQLKTVVNELKKMKTYIVEHNDALNSKETNTNDWWRFWSKNCTNKLCASHYNILTIGLLMLVLRLKL